MFKNSVVVVTGAAGALGQAVVQYFLTQGAKVAALDISDELLGDVYKVADSEQLHLQAVDLTSRDDCQKAANDILTKWSKVDVLANVAGGFTMGEKVHETSDQTWDFLFNLNTKSIVHTSSVFVPAMQKQGSGKIINIAAGAAHQGVALMGAYVASKSAVLRLTETMAQELREENINVNSILPSMIDTPRNRADMPDADFSKWVPTEKIAQVVGFLASDAASEIHGAGLPVIGLS